MGLLGAVGSIIGGIGQYKGGKILAGGYDEASGIAQGQYDKDRPLYDPYIQAGQNSLADIAANRGFYNQQFGEQDIYSDPSYRFRFNEGLRAAKGALNAAGGYGGGNTLAGLTQYGQQAASQEYQNAYNRFQDSRNQSLNRLLGIANQGQFGVSGAVGLGTHLSDTLGAYRIGRAGARARGTVGLWSGIGGAVGQMGGGGYKTW